MELEEQVMGIIINAGQSRSLCYEALHAAKAGDFATADAKCRKRRTIPAKLTLYRPSLSKLTKAREKPK